MSNWVLLLVAGVLYLLAGLFCLANPGIASLTVEQFAGWAFIVIGLLQIVEAFRADDWGGRIWSLAVGVLAALLGANLVAEPLKGLITLTIIAGILFLVSGIVKIIVGLRVQDSMLKFAVLLSGILSVVLAGMIITNLPSAALSTLGFLVGIQLLSDGIGTIALALSRRSGGVSHSA